MRLRVPGCLSSLDSPKNAFVVSSRTRYRQFTRQGGSRSVWCPDAILHDWHHLRDFAFPPPAGVRATLKVALGLDKAKVQSESETPSEGSVLTSDRSPDVSPTAWRPKETSIER